MEVTATWWSQEKKIELESRIQSLDVAVLIIVWLLKALMRVLLVTLRTNQALQRKRHSSFSFRVWKWVSLVDMTSSMSHKLTNTAAQTVKCLQIVLSVYCVAWHPLTTLWGREMFCTQVTDGESLSGRVAAPKLGARNRQISSTKRWYSPSFVIPHLCTTLRKSRQCLI